MTEAEILAGLQQIASTQLRVDRTLSPDDSLLADLDLDSVQLISLAIAVEEQFDVALPPETAGSIRTVGELCGLIATLRQQRRLG